MISKDMIGPLMIARDAQCAGLSATSLETAHWQLKRIGVVLDILEEAADRVKTLEQQSIPPHWLRQAIAPADYPPNVVPLRRARHTPIHHGGAA